MKIRNISLLTLALLLSIGACRKKTTGAVEDADKEKNEIVLQLADNVIIPTYVDLASKSDSLESAVMAFIANANTNTLQNCRNSWLTMRKVWEQSEGFLFGPVATLNIDPRIDTWPVNFETIDSILNLSGSYSDTFIETLEDALKGFHPIEYILYGVDGSKTANNFTVNEKNYLLALTKNLKKLAKICANDWISDYRMQFTVPSNSGAYPNRKAVYTEVVSAMAGICSEVADGKLAEPFLAKDPSLEESPFSGNSITDFTNNIKSVQNMYLGKFNTDGKGVEDFVKLYNLSLHNRVLQKINAALTALDNITLPFGLAINQQQFQVQNAINAIGELGVILDTEVMDLVKLKGD